MNETKHDAIRTYYRTLFAAWGEQHWWPAQSRLEMIVGAYLTQNTSWTNVEKALGNLRRARLLTVHGIRRTPQPKLEQLIRPAGYFRQKAQRLKTFVNFLDARYGGSLARMFARPTADLRDQLLALNGVGPETADSILLYAGNHPVFVVDAYTRRILERHQIVSSAVSYEEIRQLFEQALSETPPPKQSLDGAPAAAVAPRGSSHRPSRMSSAERSTLVQAFNEMHGLIVGVGKTYCLKSQPRCDDCPLRKFLPPGNVSWSELRQVNNPIRWRAFLVCAAAAVCLGFGVNGEQTLREDADTRGLLVGTAVRPAQLSEAAYASTLAREFNMLEPEDALKWEVVHPEKQAFDFSQADQAVDFAIRHNMKVRGHTLVWHQQNPKWLTQGKFTSRELAQLLEQHIKTVVGHYRDRIFAWDVVNEAFDELHPGTLRSTLWRNEPGIGLVANAAASYEPRAANISARPELEARNPQQAYSYIERCFRWAHEADPQALLFYNEAEAETMSPKSDAIYAMVRDFRQRGVPIDGVGFQMHIANLHADVASISANINRFTALGVQVHITEMDVALPVDANGNARPEDLQRQADIYREIATACVSHARCTAIQTWGFTDKYSWIGSHSKQTQGAALPFDRDYRTKPAYEALRKALELERNKEIILNK
jgi:endo-1,4-beta-xylanase